MAGLTTVLVLSRLRKLLLSNWKEIALVCVVIAICLWGWLHYRADQQRQEDLSDAREQITYLQGEVRKWQGHYRAVSSIRDFETARDRQALTDERRSCAARVAEARRQRDVIREIVTREVPVDANNCPVRGIITADELRNATGG